MLKTIEHIKSQSSNGTKKVTLACEEYSELWDFLVEHPLWRDHDQRSEWFKLDAVTGSIIWWSRWGPITVVPIDKEG